MGSRRRKNERREAINGAVEPQGQESVEAPAEQPAPQSDHPTETRELVEQADSMDALEELFLTTRNDHPLIPAIRMFTAMLDEARGGYASDRLGELEDGLGIQFNQLERDGIVRVAMAHMDEHGIPDVEHGIGVALDARAEVEQRADLEEDEYVDYEAPESDDDVDDEPEVEDLPDGAYVAKTEEGRRLEAEGAAPADIEATDEEVAEREGDTSDEQ